MAIYTYTGPNMVLIDKNGNKTEHPANCYGGNKLKTGDQVELDDYLSIKADKNPNYEKYDPSIQEAVLVEEKKPAPKKQKEKQVDIEEITKKD